MRRIAAVVICVLAASGNALGQTKTFRVHYGDDFVPGMEIAAAANAANKNAKAVGIAFIPDKIRRVRAVIVLVERAPRSPMSAQGRFGDAAWRRLSASCECALLYFRVDTVRAIDVNTPVDGNVLRNSAAGGGDALTLLMQRLADESGRRELATAPFVFWGWSASAAFGTTFAERFPQRTLAVIRYHTHLREQRADMGALAKTPMLLIAGGKDETAGTENAEALWKAGRERDSAWTLVVEPAARHGDEKALMATQQLMFPWIIAVVAQRASADDSTLRAVTTNGGWFGSRKTGEIGPYRDVTGGKEDTTWLPDEAAAKGWQRVFRGLE